MESMAADEDFEHNQDSSFSEDELLPARSSSVSESASTPGQCPQTRTSDCQMIACIFITVWGGVVFSSSAVCAR